MEPSIVSHTVNYGGEIFESQPEPRGDNKCKGCAFEADDDKRCGPTPCAGVIFVHKAAPAKLTGKTAAQVSMLLSEDPAIRKSTPITTGVLDYFPRALAAVAQCSKAGNDQHNPGQPLHWAKEKSTDHADCIARHLIDRKTVDTDGIRHAAKLAWRALALLETLLEAEEAE